MTDDDIKDLRDGFWALGNPTRLRIVLAVPHSGVDLHAKLIGKILNIQDSTCSKHLRILSRARILVEERTGQYVNYKVNVPRVRELLDFLQGRVPKEATHADSR